ncbi:MAG: hypothetical protein EPO07_17100 [Verrucomicrobia bacterium]|nr:MAG: hypothetical protein EPO07_17100 [Verrucomicrobiota bacterium]
MSAAKTETILVTGISNQEFLRRYAAAGRIGLSTGTTLVDRMIARAERHLDPQERWGTWSHAFLFEGERVDGQHWLIESDLQVHHKHIQLGVQENRAEKYHDESLYTTLAVLDFGLDAAQVDKVLREALDLVANRTRYSLRELLGTLIALRRDSRAEENLLAQNQSLFCSAFVQHIFRSAGFDLMPGVNVKLTTPQDLSQSPLPHTMYLLRREVPTDKLGKLKARVKRRMGAELRLLKKRTKAS